MSYIKIPYSVLLLCVLIVVLGGYYFYKRDVQSHYRKEAINLYKIGQVNTSLPMLIKIIEGDSDDLTVRRLIANAYALALGVDENRELAQFYLSCDEMSRCNPGEIEYGIFKAIEAGKGNLNSPEISSEFWLNRSKQLGYRGSSRY